jgi:hypothetical protein
MSFVNSGENMDWIKLVESSLSKFNDSQQKISIIVPLIQEFLNNNLTSITYLACINQISKECDLPISFAQELLNNILKEKGTIM